MIISKTILLIYTAIILCIVRYGNTLSYKKFIISLNDHTFDRAIPRLGVDYGPRLIGIASTNMLGMVTPIFTITNQANQTSISLRILTIAKQQHAREIIVGLPLDRHGDMSFYPSNFNGRLCANFASVLACVSARYYPQLQVRLFDESHSTREAQRKLAFGRKKPSLDAMSAACILERYLDDEGGGSLLARAYTWPMTDDQAIFNYQEVKDHIRDLYYDYKDKDRPTSPRDTHAVNKQRYFRYFTIKKYANDHNDTLDDS